LLLADPLPTPLLWVITSDHHILAHVTIERPDDRCWELKICVSEMILDSHQYIPAA
jgi:hypothetical protein